jgi:hypothetical protein
VVRRVVALDILGLQPKIMALKTVAFKLWPSNYGLQTMALRTVALEIYLSFVSVELNLAHMFLFANSVSDYSWPA